MEGSGNSPIVELFRQQKTEELRERAKELACLYSISKIIEQKNMSIADMIGEIVNIIPPSFQHSEITCGRIIFNESEFTTDNFKETSWRVSSDIFVNDESCGRIEVYYLVRDPRKPEPPFLKEERFLINEISARISQEIIRRRTERELRDSEERYRNLVQRLPFAILVLDGERIIFANSTFLTLIGAGPECVVTGREFLDFIHVDCRKTVREGLGELARNRDTVPPFEIKLIQLIDKYAVEVEASFVRTDSASDGEVQVVLQDIRDRREALARNHFENLSKRERQVMRLVVLGETSKTIATHLGLSPKTVESHRVRLMRKMNARTLAELIQKARMLNIF